MGFFFCVREGLGVADIFSVYVIITFLCMIRPVCEKCTTYKAYVTFALFPIYIT